MKFPPLCGMMEKIPMREEKLMKKILSVFIVAVMCCGLMAGCGKKSKEWCVEDFSFYDEDEKEVYFLTTEDDRLSLKEINDEDNKEYLTYRGVKIGERATTALDNYDLSGFNYEVTSGYYRSATDEEEAYNQEFHDKYESAYEAVENSNEIYKNSPFDENAELFLYSYFYEDSDGKLIQYEIDEEGNVADEIKDKNYEIYIDVNNEKISDITVQLKDFSSL